MIYTQTGLGGAEMVGIEGFPVKVCLPVLRYGYANLRSLSVLPNLVNFLCYHIKLRGAEAHGRRLGVGHVGWSA